MSFTGWVTEWKSDSNNTLIERQSVWTPSHKTGKEPTLQNLKHQNGKDN